MSCLTGRGLVVLVPLLLAMLAGCAGDRKTEYVSEASKESSKKSLEVPPDLVSPGRDTRFQVPADPRRNATSANALGKAIDTQSAPAANPDQQGKMRIARAGSQRWLVIPGTAEAVWPRVRKFWEDMGFTIKTDSTQLYIMETDWAEKREKTQEGIFSNVPLIRALISNSERSKYRTRLESGAEPGTVELYVSQRALEEADLSRTGPTPTNGWITKPGDQGQEMEMLRRLMLAFGSTEADSLQAVKDIANTADKARLVNTAEGNWQLNLDGTVDRTWRQIGLSLDRVGMVVEDRDRAKGIYFVRYITDVDLDKKKDGSWYSWMLFWKSEEKKKDTDLFRIVVKTDGQNTSVIVLDSEGARATAASSKQILGLLYNELK